MRLLTMIRYLLLTMILVGTAACGPDDRNILYRHDAEAEKVSYGVNDHYPSNYAISMRDGWAELPIRFQLGPGFRPDQMLMVEQAFSLWNEALKRDILILESGALLPPPEFLFSSLDDDINAIYLRQDWCKTGKSHWVLGTAVWDSNFDRPSQFTKADIHLNAQAYDISDQMALYREPVDMVTLLLHELGHVLGLAHIYGSIEDSIMNPHINIGEGLHDRYIRTNDAARARFALGLSDTEPTPLVESQAGDRSPPSPPSPPEEKPRPFPPSCN